MTPCRAFGSTSEVALYYAVEPDGWEPFQVRNADDSGWESFQVRNADDSGWESLRTYVSGEVEALQDHPITWYRVPMTGESLDASLTSAFSEQLTTQRAYAGSKLVQGEVAGTLNYEMQSGPFLYDMLIAALQADAHLTASGAPSWADEATIKNGAVKHCLAFLKRVEVDEEVYDWYLFRNCQVSSLSAEIQPNALITGAVAVMGLKPQPPLKAVEPPALWSFEDANGQELMSGSDSLQGFSVYANGVPVDVVMQSVSLTIDNQLRQQPAVGIGHPFAAGIASGRLSVKFSGQAYYRNPTIYGALLNDHVFEVFGTLRDASGNGFAFESGFVKAATASIPMAQAPDQDLLTQTDFQAFEKPVSGTLSLRKVSSTLTGASLEWMFADALGGYWPEPVASTVWQDTAGTTAGAVGSPVALRMDVSGGDYHAIQSTLANCPILRVTPETGKYWLDADSTDSLIATFPSALGSACTEATLDPEWGVVWTENKTVGTTYDVLTKYGYNGPRFLIDRALTAAEKALVEALMLQARPNVASTPLNSNAYFNDGTTGWEPLNEGVSLAVTDGVMALTKLDGGGTSLTAMSSDKGSVTAGKAYAIISRSRRVSGASNNVGVIFSGPVNSINNATTGSTEFTRRAFVTIATSTGIPYIAIQQRGVVAAGSVIEFDYAAVLEIL